MFFTIQHLKMKLEMMILHIVHFIFLACVIFGSSMAIAIERDLIIPDGEANENIVDTLDAIETWEERYQQFQDSMNKNETKSKHYSHAVDQEYARLERLGYKAQLLRDVVRNYTVVEKYVLRMTSQYVRVRNGQSKGQCDVLLRSLTSSREMVNVGYQLNNKELEVMVLILALTYLSDSCQERQEMYVDTRRIEEQLLKRHRDLTRHKETLRQWINALRDEAGKG